MHDRYSGEVRLRIYIDRVDGAVNLGRASGIHAENLGHMARSMGLTVLFEQIEPRGKCIEVQGFPRDVGRFAERCFALAVDDAVPGRNGWSSLIPSDGARIDISLETFPPGYEPENNEFTDR